MAHWSYVPNLSSKAVVRGWCCGWVPLALCAGMLVACGVDIEVLDGSVERLESRGDAIVHRDLDTDHEAVVHYKAKPDLKNLR